MPVLKLWYRPTLRERQMRYPLTLAVVAAFVGGSSIAAHAQARGAVVVIPGAGVPGTGIVNGPGAAGAGTGTRTGGGAAGHSAGTGGITTGVGTGGILGTTRAGTGGLNDGAAGG